MEKLLNSAAIQRAIKERGLTQKHRGSLHQQILDTSLEDAQALHETLRC
jgi:hypothetical protein